MPGSPPSHPQARAMCGLTCSSLPHLASISWLPQSRRVGDSWRMSNPLVQELPVLIGVGVGALASFATTSLGERARWRQERGARWDEARMRAYAEYGDAVKKVTHLASRIAAGRGFPHSVESLTPDAEAIEDLSNAGGERARAWESVLLLGDPETVSAARARHQSVWRLEWFAAGRLRCRRSMGASHEGYRGDAR